ncbi:uncharacterized protein MONOS_17424 [Monocercomonoides exilis]|uniref:uncharacterized protein n=1 Tax=Monocercomonoides exilis TaxID=2049356 RepID=UPI00355A4C8B|nr:hypothetical protein MONOS_17424 [Monocercomonoides exilis]
MNYFGKKCSKLDFSKETIIDWDNAPDHGFSSKGYKETYKIYKKNLLKMPKGEPIYLDVFECLCNDKCFHKSYVMCVVLLIPFSIASVIYGLGVRWLCVAGIPEFLFIILVPCALKIFIDGKQMEDGKMKLRVGTYLCNFIKLVGFVMNILKKDAGWNVPWSVAAIGNYLYFAVGAFFSFYIGRELDVTFFGIAICILNVAAEIVQILCALWMDGIIRSIAVALIPVDIVLAAFMFIAPYVVLKLLSAGLYDCYEDVEYNRIEENRRRKYGKIWKKKAKICDSMYLELKIH